MELNKKSKEIQGKTWPKIEETQMKNEKEKTS